MLYNVVLVSVVQHSELSVAYLVSQRLKHLPGMQETRGQSLSWEGPLEKEMATHSSTLAWRINPLEGGAW